MPKYVGQATVTQDGKEIGKFTFRFEAEDKDLDPELDHDDAISEKGFQMLDDIISFDWEEED